MTLSTAQRERIINHLQHGWKLPDSLILELWEAYKVLEESHVLTDTMAEANILRQQPAAPLPQTEETARS